MIASLQIYRIVQTSNQLNQHVVFSEVLYASYPREHLVTSRLVSDDPSKIPILDNMKKLHRQWISDKNNIKMRDEFNKIRNLCQFQLHKLKQTWLREKSQYATDKCEFKSLYLFEPVSNVSTPSISSTDDLVTDKSDH